MELTNFVSSVVISVTLSGEVFSQEVVKRHSEHPATADMKEWYTKAHYVICTSKGVYSPGPAQLIQLFSSLVEKIKQEFSQLLETQVVFLESYFMTRAYSDKENQLYLFE